MRARTQRHAESFQWKAFNHAALAALEEMAPLLVNKQPHLLLARDYMANVHRASWTGPAGMPQGEIDRRVAIRQAFMHLNRRGPRD
jgi:hypothetical protein